MKRLKIKDTFHKIIDGFDVNESSREVKYSNVKIDFTGKGIEDLPLKYQECQLVDGDFRHIDADDGQRIEGTNLQVNQGVEKLSELEYVKGQTSQSGTPTPSSPIPINITTGRQVVSVCGKNHFSDTLRQGVTIYNTGVWSNSNTRITSTDWIQLKAGTYTISAETTSTGYRYLMISNVTFDANGVFYNISGVSGQWKKLPFTFTTPIDLNWKCNISFNDSAVITPSDVYNIQIEEGNSVTSFEEYKGNDYEINLGKNLMSLKDNTNTANGLTGTISGNTITISGTNTKTDINWVLVGTTTTLGNSIFPNFIPGETYTISADKSVSGVYLAINYYKNGTTTQGGLVTKELTTTTYATFTVPSDYTGVAQAFIGILRTATTINETFHIQLEKGGIPTTFAPYKTPIYMGNINNYLNFIRKGTGKNLLDNSILELFNSNKYVKTPDYNTKGTIIVKPNTTYTFSTQSIEFTDINVFEFDENNNKTTLVKHAITRKHSFWFTTSATTKTISFYSNNNGLEMPSNLDFQIEVGNQATLYEPYGYEGQWYIHKEIGRVVLNGSENWKRTSVSGSNSYAFWNQYTNLNIPVGKYGQKYCDRFEYQEKIWSQSTPNHIAENNNWESDLSILFNVDNTIATTLQEWNTWLSTHNTDVYYILNTPTNTLIEDEELINQLNSIELLEGLNNVSVSSPYLSGIIGLHYNYQIEQDIEKVNEVIYTGYVNNYTLPKMKNKLEYRELDIDLLSPLALATLRTTDAVGTYNLRDLIREIIQPLIDDGFTLKELNVGNNQISVNYLTETIESSLNKLSNKFNFWWYIDKNKNIFINDISYIFNKNKVLTYDDNNKINGLIDFTPSMESIDYCNTIDFSNVRLFTYSYYSLRYRTIGGENIPYYTSYNPMFKKEILNPGDEITFDIPFVINTSKSGLTDTSYQTSDYCFKIEKKVGLTYPIAVQLLQDSNNQVIIPSNATISDSFNESKEFVFVRDNFFKNLIVGMKYNGSSAITISDISSTTALMLTKLRINDNEEIEKNKDIISTTGIVEKQIDANEQWLTYNQVLEIAKTLIGNNNVNVEKVNMLTDNENNLKVGDIITIDKPGFLTNGDFVITDKKRKYYDNVDQWEFVLNNTNILESYIDLFRSTDEQENEEEKFSLITGSYINEGVIEKYEVDVQ